MCAKKQGSRHNEVIFRYSVFMRKTGAVVLSAFLLISLAACGTKEEPTPQPTVTVNKEATPTPEETESSAEPEALMTEQEALESLATISSSATSEQWRSIAKAVCEELVAVEKPNDELGDTSINAANSLWAETMVTGTGDTAASFPSADLSGVQMSLMILSSTQIYCPQFQQDAAKAAETLMKQ